jgi:hypothetical protein
VASVASVVAVVVASVASAASVASVASVVAAVVVVCEISGEGHHPILLMMMLDISGTCLTMKAEAAMKVRRAVVE